MSTTITGTKVVIPGQEVKLFTGFDLTVDQVRASFTNTVDLSSMNVNETLENGWKVLTFTPRTGTKGAITGTKVVIPGQEVKLFTGFDLTVDQVRASFTNTVDLSSMNVNETLENGWKVLTFTPRTGTKG